MKLTLSWLKDYLETEASLSEILDAMNNIGLEIEECEDKASQYKKFNCVLVEECVEHPDSNHLHICKVRYSKEKGPITVVCGAPNVRTGLKTILAPVDSVLPNGTEIKKSKIRGVESNGMLCSGKELSINNDFDGIIELKDDVEIGTNVANIFGINDVIIDISLTPNKGDCLSVYGVARDLSATGIGKLKELNIKKINNAFKSEKTLAVEDKNCPYFAFRHIKNIKNCESPEWIKNRLLAVDINPKNALVDITNYVMLTLGQPLHCYDCNKIDGNITIKQAKEGQEFIDLFNVKHTLNGNETLICDDRKILCLGGIMGGLCSSTEDNTNKVILESACFNAINTAKSARLLGLNSDAKFRYERGIDYGMIENGLNYATQLIEEICGGEASEIVSVIDKEYEDSIINKQFELNINKIEKVIGLKIPEEEILKILNDLGYKVKINGDVLTLTVPTWKNQICVKEDIIDDIVRIYGYDKLQTRDFIDNNVFEKQGNNFVKTLRNKLFEVRKQLVKNGITELMSYAFINQKDCNLFAENNDDLKVLNPIFSDLSYMRQNLLPSMLNAIKKNNNRGFNDLTFFEIGKIFHSNKPTDEELMISGIRYGKNKEKDIFEPQRNFDIYDVKKDLFDVLKVLNVNPDKLMITKNVPSYYHPNRAGALCMGKVVIGYFGELHPRINKHFDLKQRINAFEVFVNNIPEKTILNNDNIKTFIPNDLQTVKRDFAFILDKNVEVDNILREVQGVNKQLITNVKLFDVYSDEKMNGKKSIAFNITIQPIDKTLTKEEIDAISDNIIKLVSTKYKGELRDKTL